MEVQLEFTLDVVYVIALFLPQVLQSLHPLLPRFFLATGVFARLEDHIIQECAPNFSQLRFWFPPSLLANLSTFIVKVEPVPFVVRLGIASHLV